MPFPDTVDDLTAAWFTAALGREVTAATVVGHDGPRARRAAGRARDPRVVDPAVAWDEHRIHAVYS